MSEDFRAGFVAIVGRPNAGKSTLTNAMVGEKIVITANQPETTRRAVRGIVQRPNGQLILVDTPGLHRPRTLLGERLNDMVRDSLEDVDAVVMCLPADEKVGPGDKYLLGVVAHANAPVYAVITKVDKVSRDALAAKIIEVSQIGDFAEIVPVSAVKDEQVDLLASLILQKMPPSPPLYPSDSVTDASEEDRIADLIREASLEGVRDELPHSIAVVIEEMEERPRRRGDNRPPIVDIQASIFVERDSQKGIVIGKGGSRLRTVGSQARAGIEQILGKRVFLSLRVKVAKDWQRDPKQLGKLGF
ncbi:GTP-binding protein Era [Arcanobacterium wilhelmae]|uniref:GTPase Era n=1 Tax=Arcanobacterium wilhelmae TaxID=1803177 RepID=A0ABT9NDD8_9ACTO|nr:GTPase Era [Arcanobacterium wilhelmae]MDP9801732.1 GTP-binding protein Era [Arcanobacterium wilhelmae]WFN91049.1 GTPase Era [Arcanobacterium wilhelmae]